MPKRMRMKMVDINGFFAVSAIPMADYTVPSDAVTIQNAYQLLVRPGIQETDYIIVVDQPLELAGSGSTPLVNDMAVLVFASDGPFGLKVPIIGPDSIFLPDNITINDANADVANLISLITTLAADRAGNIITDYLGGQRVGAGGP